MTPATPVKARLKRPLVVGVITSPTELRRAASLRNPPDLFELRLDYLLGREEALAKVIPKLPAPIIITARHPAEGGVHKLGAEKVRIAGKNFWKWQTTLTSSSGPRRD